VALIGLPAHHRPEADLVPARTIGQGFDMGRPSILEASAEKKASDAGHDCRASNRLDPWSN
jgi:trans-2,3-dihydro-3-hydroxyanthranilate isomerase